MRLMESLRAGVQRVTGVQPRAPFTDAEFRGMIDSVVEAASSTAEYQLLLEDRGWVQLGVGDKAVPESLRRKYVQRARTANKLDGAIMQMVALWTNFGIGWGVSWKAREKRTQDALDDFMLDPMNACVLSEVNQRGLSDELQTDGELFFAIFAKRGKTPRIRTLDALEITEVVTDPEDKDTPLWYVRETSDGKRVAYCDWHNTSRTPGKDSAGAPVPSSAVVEQKDVVVYHVKLRGRDTRGWGWLAPVLDWSKADVAFMNSRLAIQQSLSRFALKNKSKAGQAALTTLAAAVESQANKVRTDSGRRTEPGAMWFENQATDLSSMSQETGAAAAKIDGDMIMQHMGMGAGVFPHYLGAGDAFRLATATAMEAPMLKAFEGYRAVWYGIWEALFDFVCEVAGIPEGEARYVDIDLPEIYPAQAATEITALVTLLSAFPEFAESKEVQALALTKLGLNNVSDIIDRLKEDADKRKVAMPEPPPVAPPPVPPGTDQDADTDTDNTPATEAQRIAVDDLILGIDRILDARKQGTCNHDKSTL